MTAATRLGGSVLKDFLAPGRATRSQGRSVAARRVLFVVGLLCSAATGVAAQQDRIGIIDYFGYGTLTRAQLDGALGLKVGEPLPTDTAAIIARMRKLPGVQQVTVDRICCVEAGTQLFVGLVLKGAPSPTWNRRPTGSIRVSDSMRVLYDSLMERVFDAAMANQMEDSVTEGHSLLAYPPARELQLAMQRYTVAHEVELRQVLRTSSADADRAIAADALGYAADKKSVIGDLVAAARDPYPETRNNAVRALYAIGMLAQRKPELGIQVPFSAIVPLLNSPVWTDRNKTSMMLFSLSQSRDPALMQLLRAQAMGSLVEIARWQSPGHAFPGLFLVARITGMSDEDAFNAYQAGDREKILSRASSP